MRTSGIPHLIPWQEKHQESAQKAAQFKKDSIGKLEDKNMLVNYGTADNPDMRVDNADINKKRNLNPINVDFTKNTKYK